MSIPPKPPRGPERRVPLSKFVGRDVIGELREFLNEAGRDDTIRVSGCPVHLRDGLEVFRHTLAPSKTMNATIAYALDQGSLTLLRLSVLEEIKDAHRIVLVSGDERISEFRTWRFDLNLHHRGSKDLRGRALPEVQSRVGVIADTLGLGHGVVAALCIEVVLMQVVSLPDESKTRMRDEVQSFVERVRARAVYLSTIARDVKPAKVTDLAYSFDDFIN